jgi:hypothetical protein
MFLGLIPQLLKDQVMKSPVFLVMIVFMVSVAGIFFMVRLIKIKSYAASEKAQRDFKNTISNFATSFIIMFIFPLAFFGFLGLVNILFNLIQTLFPNSSSFVENI